VEPFRALPVRLTHQTREYRTSVLALEPESRLRAIVDMAGSVHRVPPRGILLARPLADTLRITGASVVRLEVLEGERRVVMVPVAGIVDDLMGMSAYISLESLTGLTGGDVTLSGGWMRVDPRRAAQTFAALKHLPAVAGVSSRTAALEGFERTIAESFRISLVTTLGFACIIAFGIVYSTGRITLSERARELASLRVLGFTKRETSMMLVGEQGLLTLFSLPLAAGVAFFLAWLIAVRFESTLFRLPVVISPMSQVLGAAAIVLSAAASALLTIRRLGRMDLVSVLKTRE
jgi:putative ABC transport system permease protein